MTAKPFLDTNVLVYAFSDDDSRKNDAASLIASGGVVSVQILNEFVDVARRKLRKDSGRHTPSPRGSHVAVGPASADHDRHAP